MRDGICLSKGQALGGWFWCSRNSIEQGGMRPGVSLSSAALFVTLSYFSTPGLYICTRRAGFDDL